MIKSPTAFPMVGSYALYEAVGLTQLVRIQYRDPEGEGLATISFPGTYGASGNKIVAVADLIDGTPLTSAERAEYKRLEQKLSGAARPRKADIARERDLRTREIMSDVLREKMERAGLATEARQLLEAA